MSKKVYEEAAARIRKLPLVASDREAVAATLAQVFKMGNARFDEEKFMAACRPGNETEIGAVDPDTLTRILIDYQFACLKEEGVLPSLASIVDVANESVASTERAAG